MQRIVGYICIALLIELGNLSVSAQTAHYQTKLLQQMAARIGSIPATSANGYQEVGIYRGHPIVAACDSSGMITHLGLRLFSLQMNREDLPAIQHAIMDFLERYSLDLLTQSDMTVDEKLRFDKVLFRYGSPDDILRISSALPFAVTTNEKYYEVTWSQDEKPFVTIAFPAQFELILGMPAAEIQHCLKGYIRNARPRDKSFAIPPKIEKRADNVFVSKNDTLYLSSVSNATYYYNKGEGIEPIFDDEQLEYAAANLLQGVIPNDDYRMYVDQSVYGMKSIEYMVSLSQWLDYQTEQGFKVYCGLEELREDGLKMLVIAKSQELGYHHLLSIVIPVGFIKNRNAILKAHITAFIPTDNVKNLYYQESSDRKKIEWQ